MFLKEKCKKKICFTVVILTFPFIPNALFLYPLKTSEKLNVLSFWINWDVNSPPTFQKQPPRVRSSHPEPPTFRHGCSPVNLLHIFRTSFSKNTSNLENRGDLENLSFYLIWNKSNNNNYNIGIGKQNKNIKIGMVN